jgi:hypothetical protein
MGHMLNNTIQDVLVRRARMQGKNACWVPGTDHAAIATEAKVVAKLDAEGIKKSDLTREQFLEHVWEWTHKHGGIILEQLKKLGCSCDWDRTCFTMDDVRSQSVLKVFIDLYNKGLIYRGVRMVNWDPQAKTALSDEEVIFKEQQGKLYYLKYKVVDDTAVAPASLQNLDYNECKKKMSDYESRFENDSLSSLKNMIDLYGKLKHTSFHDIANAVELWIDAYPDKRLLEYIKEKNDNYCNRLADIINAKNAPQSSPKTNANEGKNVTVKNLNDDLPKGWFITNGKDASALLTELQKELPQGHLLFGQSVKVIANRQGATDDILCQYENDLTHFTVIHLTWSGKTEKSVDLPFVECDGNFNDFIKYENTFSSPVQYAIVATTRPETIFGDTAMCINPNDPKTAWLKGKRVIVPIVDREIPVIEDEYVDMEFGTGCLKVTPAHDVNDYMLGEKYGLETLDIFNDDGTLNQYGLHYEGKDRFAVRRQIEKELEEKDLLEKTENYTNKVGFSERTDVAIEPKLSMQWFLKMEELAKPALENVENDTIKFYPEKFKNTYRHWLENIKDWNISRQLWWGHQIPAWYVLEEEEKN